MIVLGMGTNIADGGFHIVDLCREFCVTATTMVDAYYGKAGIHQRFAD